MNTDDDSNSLTSGPAASMPGAGEHLPQPEDAGVASPSEAVVRFRLRSGHYSPSQRTAPAPPSAYMYWSEAWHDAVHSKGSRLGVDLRTLPVVLEDLETQVQLDQLSNRQARKNFADDLTRLLARNWVREPYERHIRLLLEGLRTWSGWRTFLHLVRDARAEVDATFHLHCSAAVASIVSGPPPSTKMRRQLVGLANDLIVCLLAKDLSPSFVSSVPEKLADGYYLLTPQIVTTDFPHNIPHNESNPEESARQIVAHMSSLTWGDRVLALPRFVECARKTRRYVFQLRGLRVTEPIEFGNVHIYNPFFSSRTIPSRWNVDERFGQDQPDLIQFPNIEVTIQAHPLDNDGAERIALAAIERHLDLLSAHVPQVLSLSVRTDAYIVTDPELQYSSGGSRRPADDPLIHFNDSYDLDEDTSREDLASALSHPSTAAVLAPAQPLQRRVSLAVAAVARAEAAHRPAQQLLGYWTAIETLIDIESWRSDRLIDDDTAIVGLATRSIVPLYFQYDMMFAVGWRLHAELRNFVAHEGVLPQRLVEHCRLTPLQGQVLALAPLLDRLNDIEAALSPYEDAEYLSDMVVDVRAFYLDPKATIKAMDNGEEAVAREMIAIYRARNRLVHDAFERTPFLREAALRAGRYARYLLIVALKSPLTQEADLRDALTRSESKYVALKARLRNGTRLDLDEHA